MLISVFSMTGASNDRLDINNAIKCDIRNDVENALCKKKLSVITELLPYGCSTCI